MEDTGLAVVPSLSYFDAACSGVLWREQRLIVVNEIAQNSLQQGSYHIFKPKTPFLHQYGRYRAGSGTTLELF